MSLFERIQNKRYDLQEQRIIKKKYGNKNKNKLSGGFENVTGEGNVDYPKTRKELEAKRKEYGIDYDKKTKQTTITKDGVENYAREIKRSNLPLTKDEIDKARRYAIGGKQIKNEKDDVIGTTTGKYGGRLAKKRSKNAKSYAELMADINKRNPTINTPIGKLPKTAANKKKFSFAKRAGKFIIKNKRKAGLIGLGIAAATYGASKLFGGKKSKNLDPAPSSELRKLSYSKYIDSKTNNPISYTFGAGKYDKDKNPGGNKIDFPINSLQSKKALAAGLKNKSLYLSKKIKPS